MICGAGLFFTMLKAVSRTLINVLFVAAVVIAMVRVLVISTSGVEQYNLIVNETTERKEGSVYITYDGIIILLFQFNLTVWLVAPTFIFFTFS